MSDKKKLIRSVVTGTLCGMLTSIILMCVFAVVMLKGGLLDAPLIDYIMAALYAAGGLAGGFIAAKMNKGAGLIVGAATGAVMILVLVLTAAIRGESDFTALFVIKLCAAVLAGAAGGIWGVREKKHINI